MKGKINDCSHPEMSIKPQCFTLRVGERVDRYLVQVLKEKIRTQREEIQKLLLSMQKRNMEEEMEKMIAAIYTGNVQPIDF